jgi:hypothetical protein
MGGRHRVVVGRAGGIGLDRRVALPIVPSHLPCFVAIGRSSPSPVAVHRLAGCRASHLFHSFFPSHALLFLSQAPTLLRLVAPQHYSIVWILSSRSLPTTDTIAERLSPHLAIRSQPTADAHCHHHSLFTVYLRLSFSPQAGPGAESPTAHSSPARRPRRIFLDILGGELASSCSEALSFPPCCSPPVPSLKHSPHVTH